jgi:mannitol/fructose-specific phosphotransferase system IIA component (Ntr-type)
MPMLRLADYLREDLVLWDLPSLDKASFLETLATEVAARLPAVDEEELLARLIEREEQQSTGVGNGLALPHATLPGLPETVVAVVRNREGLARILGTEEVLERLRSATGPQELFQRLLEEDARHVY